MSSIVPCSVCDLAVFQLQIARQVFIEKLQRLDALGENDEAIVGIVRRSSPKPVLGIADDGEQFLVFAELGRG